MSRSSGWLTRRALGATLCAALLVAACGSDDDTDAESGASTTVAAGSSETTAAPAEDAEAELIAAAQEEGSVVMYSPLDDAINERVAAAFEEEYGVRLEIGQKAQTPVLITRFSEEMTAGTSLADVLWASDVTFWAVAEENGWSIPLDEETIPNFGNFDPGFVGPNFTFITSAPLGVCINTNNVESDEIQVWQDVLDSGHQIISNGVQSPTFKQFWGILAESEGNEFLEGIQAADPIVAESLAPGIQLLGAGEGDLQIPCSNTVAASAIASGAPIEYIQPDGPTNGSDIAAMIQSRAEHPNAARLLINYLMSEEGQSVLNEGTGSSPLGDIPGSVPLPEGYVLQTPENLAAAIEEWDTNLQPLIGL